MAAGPGGADRVAGGQVRGEIPGQAIPPDACDLFGDGQADIAGRCVCEERDVRGRELRFEGARGGHAPARSGDESRCGDSWGDVAGAVLDDGIPGGIRAVHGSGEIHVGERPVVRSDAGAGVEAAAALVRSAGAFHAGRVGRDVQRGRRAGAPARGFTCADQRLVPASDGAGDCGRPAVPGRVGGGRSRRAWRRESCGASRPRVSLRCLSGRARRRTTGAN